jgi:hypothetical protein
MDPDPDADPAIFVSDLQNVNKKLFSFCLLLFEGTGHSSTEIFHPCWENGKYCNMAEKNSKPKSRQKI